jgi:hypothetical protein
MAANTTAKAWNGGMTGEPRRGRPIPGTATCNTDGCGLTEEQLDPSDPTTTGWVLTRVNGSLEPGRWWCSGSCAHVGIALAELRMNEGAH